MSFRTWLNALKSAGWTGYSRWGPASRKRPGPVKQQLYLEPLEEREVPAFLAPVNYGVGQGPLAVVSIDLNNDGAKDLVIVNNGSSNVSVLLGDGLGGFGTATNFDTGASPQSVAVGDVTGDGAIDIVTANGSDVSILRGDGHGSFAAPESIALPGQYPWGYTGTDPLAQTPRSVATGDFNADGKMDIAVTGITSFLQGYVGYYGGYYYYQVDNTYVNVLLSDGSGGFSPTVTTPVYGLYADSLAVGRFDAGNTDDLAIANTYYSTVSVLLSDGSGGFSSLSDFYTGYYPVSVASADVNGDSNADLITANYYGNSVSVLLGNGSGGFAAPVNYDLGAYPASVAIADFNNDGAFDIATSSNRYVNNAWTGEVNVLLGYGDGTFAAPTRDSLAAGSNANGLAVGNFDGDSLPDVAVANSGNASVFFNSGGWVLPAKLTISDVTVTEGDSGTVEAVFTVTRSAGFGATVTVNFTTADGGALAGSDYVARSGTLTFGPNDTTKTITVLVNGDLIDEYDEAFYVNLSGASGAAITDSQGVGTIVDNDPPPTVSITAKVSANEGQNNKKTMFTFFVTLSAPSEKQVEVNFATANGTATTADSDYVAKSGTLIFAPGQTSKTIAVVVNGDKKKESNETFFVNLSGASNATILDGQGIGEILDDDSPPSKGHKP